MAKYTYNDIVTFKLEDKEFTGSVYIVDPNGTFENPGKPSYDIMVDDVLWKHIPESMIVES